MLQLKANLTLCQRLCVEDCHRAICNTLNDDIISVIGKCPEDCDRCLYAERFRRDDSGWIPEPKDPQYHHWETR